MKNKIILFDLDGTLIDSTEAILESFDYAFKSFQRPTPSEDAIKAEIGHPLDVMFETLGVSPEESGAFVDAYKSHYRQISTQKTFLLPFATEAIEEASKEAILGVVTTKTARYSVILLEHLGLYHFFDVLIGREDVQNPKPDPEPILKALKALPTVTGGTWMIGDTCMDMQSANSAKVHGVGVLSGYGTEESLKKCTKIVCENALESVYFIAKY
jgi:phosphoglycolate phosphatase